MTLQLLDEYLENKLKQNNELVIYSFYEVRIKQNLKVEESLNYLHLVAIKLENLGYKIYRTGQEYIYEGQNKKVEENQLLVAIKQRGENNARK